MHTLKCRHLQHKVESISCRLISAFLVACIFMKTLAVKTDDELGNSVHDPLTNIR
jgi:hypothetical protein